MSTSEPAELTDGKTTLIIENHLYEQMGVYDERNPGTEDTS